VAKWHHLCGMLIWHEPMCTSRSMFVWPVDLRSLSFNRSRSVFCLSCHSATVFMLVDLLHNGGCELWDGLAPPRNQEMREVWGQSHLQATGGTADWPTAEETERSLGPCRPRLALKCSYIVWLVRCACLLSIIAIAYFWAGYAGVFKS